MFNNRFIANCLQNASVKNFENRLIFGENMNKSKVAGTFWPTLYIRQFYGLCKIRVNLAWRLKRRRLEFNGSLS